jgi:hypothetical protein
VPPLRALRRAPTVVLLLVVALVLAACGVRPGPGPLAAQTASAPRTPGVAVVRVVDGDRDGVACEANAPPLDLQHVPR